MPSLIVSRCHTGWVTLAACLLCATAAIAQTTPLRLDDESLPASGNHETLVHIGAFGRYSILATSGQGTALQLVDKMAGPGEIDGTPGKQDGRLDLFLDRGDYQLRTLAAPKGDGKVKLSLRASRELNPEPAPRLVEFRIESSELDDFQQRSWWLQVNSRRTVALEAAGRNLADLRLWKDGTWLVDAAPSSEELEPLPGKPLNGLLLVATLEPGLYRLSAYGGPSRPWSETSTAHPFYLRFGIPSLPEASRRRFITSPFGIDRWRVPASADYFRLELPRAEPATLSLADYDDSQPFPEGGEQGSVTKKSLPPVAELRTGSYDGLRVVTVRREAGQPYLLQNFHALHSVTVNHSGQYWVSTLHSGNGEDAPDVTTILAVHRYAERSWRFSDDTAIPLDTDRGWRRRFNLLAESTLFFKIKSTGVYTFKADGVDARLRLEPFLIDRPYGYRTPGFESGQLRQTLDAGLYVLTLRPGDGDNGKGIVTLSAGPEGALPTDTFDPARPAARYMPVIVGPEETWQLSLNQQPGVSAGILVRPLPIDLNQALPVTQASGETVEIPVRISETGTLTAIAEDGRPLPFRIDGSEPAASRRLSAGRYRFTLHNGGDHAINYVLAWLPLAEDPAMPLPVVTPQMLSERPHFPTLTARRSYPFDIARGETTTLNLTVAEPALYRVETTGLLATEGTLRTRTDPSFDSAAENGVGRNFLLGEYLREGDYQISVRARGKSAGHLTLRLAQTHLREGGSLLPGIPARATLKAGDGLLYRFHVAEAGDYHLQSLGLDRRFTVRLEDAGGWPLLQPGIAADIVRRFEPGDYRLLVLPQTVDARVVTLLERQIPPAHFNGHGPHTIDLDQRVEQRWLEPGPGEPRQPDVWQFTVPANIDAAITVSPEMTGQLSLDGKPVAAIDGERGWKGPLKPGSYRLELQSRRPDNRLDYALTVHSQQLVAGQARSLQVPADLPVAVGSEQPFELTSFGDQDVRATLYDSTGQILASNDDRTDDWNFFISAQLAPGQYRLHVEPVAQAAAATRIAFRVPEEDQGALLKLPARLTINDAHLHYYPVDVAGGSGQLLVVQARSGDSVGVAVEQQAGGTWETVGQQTGKDPLLALPLSDKGQLRLRAWSISRTGHPVEISIDRVAGTRFGESGLDGNGVLLSPLKGFSPLLGMAVVELQQPGQLQVVGDGADLWAGTVPGQALVHPQRGRINASGDRLWLLAQLSSGNQRSRVHLRRLILDTQGALAVTPASNHPQLNLAPLRSGHSQLVVADSSVALPGLRFTSADGGNGLLGLADLSSALLRHKSESATIEVLETGHSPGAAAPVNLRLFDFEEPQQASLRPGINDARLAADRATRFTLPGASSLQLSLPAGSAAELRHGDATVATLWTGARAQSFQIDTPCDGLTIYNTRPATVRLSVRVGAEIAPAPALTSALLGRYHFASTGSRELMVHLEAAEKSAGRRLHIFGAGTRLTALERSGQISRGTSDLLLHDDARVLIEHSPGLLLAWLSDPDGTTAFSNAVAPQNISVPGQVPLAETTALALKQSAAGAVTLSTDVPVVVRVRGGGLPERLTVFPNAAALPLFLPGGEYQLLLDRISADPGHAELHGSPIEMLHEGLNAKRLLAPGDSRFYRFHLDEDRTVGVGVRASVDIVDCVLLDGRGMALGHGLLQMHELKAGDYLLQVATPPDGETVEVQPALVGIKPPTSGPPEAVIRKYLESAR